MQTVEADSQDGFHLLLELERLNVLRIQYLINKNVQNLQII